MCFPYLAILPFEETVKSEVITSDGGSEGNWELSRRILELFTGWNRLVLSTEINAAMYKMKVLKQCKEKISTEILNTKWKIKKPGNLKKTARHDLLNDWFKSK